MPSMKFFTCFAIAIGCLMTAVLVCDAASRKRDCIDHITNDTSIEYSDEKKGQDENEENFCSSWPACNRSRFTNRNWSVGSELDGNEEVVTQPNNLNNRNNDSTTLSTQFDMEFDN